MWRLACTLCLVVGIAIADPQGYDYLPPRVPFNPVAPCPDVTSVVYSTAVRQSVVPTTIRQVNTQYRTTVLYSQRVVPTTLYQTQYQTRVQYQTSYVQRESVVTRQQIITSTQQGRPVVNTQYVTSTRITPQVSYVVSAVVRTQVVPVEVTNTRYQTRYMDQISYQTVPVQQTSVIRVPGRDVVSTQYRTQIQTSIVRQPQPAQTRYGTTTLIQNRVETRTVPSPPVVSTRYVQSQQVIPTTLVSTLNQVVYVTRTQYVTQTQYRTQTQVQTQVVPQEVLVTVDVPREVVRTSYVTRVVPTTLYQTRYNTQTIPANPVVVTQQAYETSIVRQPGPDRVVTREVINTQQRQQVVYKTQNVQSQIYVTRTITQPCAQTGYNYPEPQRKFNF